MAGPVPLPRGASLVAGLQLRRRLRDRSALLQGILAPIVLAVIITSAFGGSSSFSTTIAVVDLDGGQLGSALVDGGAALSADSDRSSERTSDPSSVSAGATADTAGVELIRMPDPDTARAAIDAGEISAAMIVPEGFSASLVGDALPLEVLVDPGRQLAGDVALSLVERVAAGVDTARLAGATAVSADPRLAESPGVDAVVAEAAALDVPVVLGPSAFGEGFDPIVYFAPSMAILFAFLTLGAGARTLIVERREGTLARIRSTPISDRAVLLGVTASLVIVGLVSFLVVWFVTAVVFGADWGDPLGVVVVIVAVVAAVAGISTLVTGLARTESQADGMSSVLAFGFALIGGGFLSPGDLPDLLARISLITPNRWALDAFAELGAGASGVSAVLTQVLVLAGIGAVTGAIGLRLVRLESS